MLHISRCISSSSVLDNVFPLNQDLKCGPGSKMLGNSIKIPESKKIYSHNHFILFKVSIFLFYKFVTNKFFLKFFHDCFFLTYG